MYMPSVYSRPSILRFLKGDLKVLPTLINKVGKIVVKSLSLESCCSASSARPARTPPTLSAVFSPTCVAFLTAAACCLISSIFAIT